MYNKLTKSFDNKTEFITVGRRGQIHMFESLQDKAEHYIRALYSERAQSQENLNTSKPIFINLWKGKSKAWRTEVLSRISSLP